MEIQLSKVRLFTWNKSWGLCISHCSISCVRPSPLIRFSFDLFQVRFHHDVYPHAQRASGPAADQPVSRQVFVVQDLEIRDRLAASQMNKFLYLYSSKEMPRKSHSNMVRKAITLVKASSVLPRCNILDAFSFLADREGLAHVSRVEPCSTGVLLACFTYASSPQY